MNSTNGELDISFDLSVVNWPLIEAWAGMAGADFNGWARTTIHADQNTTAFFICNGASTYFIDGKIYRGDSYWFNFMKLPVYLSAGDHELVVKVSGTEGTSFACSIEDLSLSSSFSSSSSSYIEFVDGQEDVIPDLVDGQLASPFFSISVVNIVPDQTVDAVAVSLDKTESRFTITSQEYPFLIGGQVRQVPFQLGLTSSSSAVSCSSGSLSLSLSLSVTIEGVVLSPITRNITIACKTFSLPYTFTFMDFDKSIQYAAVWAPKYACTDFKSGCSVLFTFHGAGVDAKSTAWTEAYVQQNYSWILYPTNRRNYGWDWQNPGQVNGFSALEYLTAYQPGVNEQDKSLYVVDSQRLLYAGHSMGGHGCWSISSHYPDRGLGVAPASGWIKFQFYTPYFSHIEQSFLSPFADSLMEAAVADHNSDFYLPHLVGVPTIVRFGSDDDNVPPYHMRRMARVLDQLSKNTEEVEVAEVPNEGHWWGGVVDDSVMQSFFDRHLNNQLPPLPESFIVTTLNPSTSEGRGGISILQLETPYRVSRIKVETNPDTGSQFWSLTTENVRRFGFYSYRGLAFPNKGIEIDGVSFTNIETLPVHFCKLSEADLSFQVCTDNTWEQTERGPHSYGPAVQILYTNPLMIVYGTLGLSAEEIAQREHQALYVANALYYQIRSSIPVYSDQEVVSLMNQGQDFSETYNVIVFGSPQTNSFASHLSINPVEFKTGRKFRVSKRTYSESGFGVMSLGKYGSQTLALTIEGTDIQGFKNAAKLIPLSSGVRVPDYAVVGPEMGWAGGGAFYEFGYWDNNWKANDIISFKKSFF